ncbi:MAG TPA: hypothetical protein VN622_11890 [Clostridia bacterium]|nr:hypothetical protein [Clostridia bacterium]
MYEDVSVPARPSRLMLFFMKTFRVILLSLMFAALGMGLGLLMGILGTVAYAIVNHSHPDVTVAYRLVAIPLAIISGLVALLYTVFNEIRTALRTRA